jgi:two-component system LytT family sensor kinase
MAAATNARPLLSWRPASVLVVLAVWTGLAALSTVGVVVAFRQTGRALDLAPFALMQASSWYSCAVFTPLFVWMARRWPIERASWPARTTLWLAMVTAIVPVRFAIDHYVVRALVPDVARRPLDEAIVAGFVPETIAFWAMAAVILSIEYYDRWRSREMQAQLLGRQLAEARLEALSAQMRPHFLFNTLQGISTLLHRDPRAADQMLARLSDLLRAALRQGETHETPLADELATLDHYFAIQRIRFADRLSVDVTADGARDALVPHFILQPLAENAIEHGIARQGGPGVVSVRAHVSGDRVIIEVRNDGPVDSEPSRRDVGGVGLANTRARLAAMYGTAASFEAKPLDTGGFTVTISLPLRRAVAIEVPE